MTLGPGRNRLPNGILEQQKSRKSGGFRARGRSSWLAAWADRVNNFGNVFFAVVGNLPSDEVHHADHDVTAQGPEPYAARLRRQYSDADNLNARLELHRRFSTNPYGWTRWVFDQISLAPEARVLELGCGTGLLWKANAGRVGASWHLMLADRSFGMLREARGNLGNLSSWASLAQADAQALPFVDSAFDAVIANHMLYHVEDRDCAISEIRRVLRPEGIFYAATNGAAHLRELDQIIGRFMGVPSVLDQNAQRFGLETGEAQLRRHFGKVELRRYKDSLLVTEAQPLLDYAASTMRTVTKEALEGMRAFIEEQLRDEGGIRISKDAGAFISRR